MSTYVRPNSYQDTRLTIGIKNIRGQTLLKRKKNIKQPKQDNEIKVN